MYMTFDHPVAGWTMGLLYDSQAVPEHLKLFLSNQKALSVRELSYWLYSHNVRGVAFCEGGIPEKIRSFRFIRRFNAEMKRYGMAADLGEFYQAFLDAKNNKI